MLKGNETRKYFLTQLKKKYIGNLTDTLFNKESSNVFIDNPTSTPTLRSPPNNNNGDNQNDDDDTDLTSDNVSNLNSEIIEHELKVNDDLDVINDDDNDMFSTNNSVSPMTPAKLGV